MPSDQQIPITSAASTQHAAEVVYGLELRGISATFIYDAGPGPMARRMVVSVKEADAERARKMLDSIWNAILDRGRDVDARGGCSFCGYEIGDLPPLVPCPECGTVIDRAVDAEGCCRFCSFDVSEAPRGQLCPGCKSDLDCVEAVIAGRTGQPAPRIDL